MRGLVQNKEPRAPEGPRLEKFDVRWVALTTVKDSRGRLTALEGGKHAPFEIRRVFYMHEVEPGAGRGGHAHRNTDQLAVAVRGSVRILVSNGRTSRVVVLDDPTWGVYLPQMTWTRLSEFSDGAICVVMASTHYDMSGSVRSWRTYLDELGLDFADEPESAAELAKSDIERDGA
jgi:dTDP-4-dehydrorhamnose 3,5-epimerase-like enzyme